MDYFIEKTNQLNVMAGQRFTSNFLTYVMLILFCVAIRVVTIQGYDIKRSRIFSKESGRIGHDSLSSELGNDYKNWVFRDPEPLQSRNSSDEPKQVRLKRSIHKEKIPRYSITNESPYSSIVYIAVGCIGTLISPIHVLTAAHCVHDGRKEREGRLMNPLKVGKL